MRDQARMLEHLRSLGYGQSSEDDIKRWCAELWEGSRDRLLFVRAPEFLVSPDQHISES